MEETDSSSPEKALVPEFRHRNVVLTNIAHVDIKKVPVDDLIDDFEYARLCLQFFITTLSILLLLGVFVIFELWLSTTSSLVETLPGVWETVAKGISNSVASNTAVSVQDECGNCPITSFCTCGPGGGPI